MGRGTPRGPKQLRFRTLVETLGSAVDRIADSREEHKVTYRLQDCYRSAFAMFYVQDPSLLAFQRRVQQQIHRNNLTTQFGVDSIPSDSQLRDVLDAHDYAPLMGVYRQWFNRLQRSKQLERYQYFGDRYLITLDGSQYFTSEKIHCRGCLHKEKSNGHTEYYHQVLQSALVHPDRRQVIPLAPEFIRMQDGSTKQDCESVAALRAVKKIRAAHRQLSGVIVGDALYATEAFITAVSKQRFSFLLGVKPGSHKTLFEDIEGFRRGGLLDRLERTGPDGRRYLYEWVSEVPLYATANSPVVNFVEFQIFDATGKRTCHFSWITDLPLSEETIEELVRGARTRWKIENETFNTLKNHGYHLEHNFGHGATYLSETFFVLNTLAFFMHQIFALVDGLYQAARSRFSSRQEYWNTIRAALQLMVFDSWDHLLERIHAPPLAAP